ncbi:MAG: efflux RND transporter periplasmic adaptor subunit [Acidobacteriota bacterium]|nr:efflux RND transporter periplasmic adaptor subunit [Acidobacteriota bacterium]
MQTNEEQKSQQKFSRSAMVGWAVAFVAIAVLMTQSGWFADQPTKVEASAKAEPTASPMAAVMLAAPGRVEGLSEVIEVGAGADGVLESVRVREGQQVAAGEVLAVVACGDVEAERQAALAATESARQVRQRLLRGSRDEERRIAANGVVSAEAVLKQAQTHYQRQSSLYETGDISRAMWEQARRDMEVAEATLRAAKDRVALANAQALPEELARAEADIRVADSRAQAMAARVGKCAVRAPQAGRVLRVHLLPGETVSTVMPRPVISLADVSGLRVRAEVDERDLGRLRVGQAVTVTADALADKQFNGRVVSFGALMGRKHVRTGDPAEKSDRDVLEVLVDLDERDERLVVGLRTTVRFLAQ